MFARFLLDWPFILGIQYLCEREKYTTYSGGNNYYIVFNKLWNVSNYFRTHTSPHLHSTTYPTTLILNHLPNHTNTQPPTPPHWHSTSHPTDTQQSTPPNDTQPHTPLTLNHLPNHTDTQPPTPLTLNHPIPPHWHSTFHHTPLRLNYLPYPTDTQSPQPTPLTPSPNIYSPTFVTFRSLPLPIWHKIHLMRCGWELVRLIMGDHMGHHRRL